MKKDRLLSLKIGATFLGTIVGAGFASGQEILSFFSIYRFDGFLGIMIAIILFAILGCIVLSISYNIKRKSYHDFLVYVCGTKMGIVVDVLITVFLFGTLNVMLSATGALFNEFLGLPYYFGIILTIIPAAIITIKGIKEILKVNLIIAPVMIITVIVISFLCLYYHGSGEFIRNIYYEDDNTYKWLMSAMLYVSYNIALSIPILVPLGKETNNKKVLLRGIIFGSLAMGLLLVLINTTILNHIDMVVFYQIPMLYIVEPFNHFIKYFFIITLWLEIFTTTLSNLYGLTNRLHAGIKIRYDYLVVGICFLSIFISRLDFKTLLSVLYPVFGLVSLLFILYLILKEIYLKIKRLNNL